MLLAHLAWPIRLDAGGQYLMVEQDSDEDIGSCLATCILWPLGTHETKPDFGITDPTFLQDGPDLEEIKGQLEDNEPRVRMHMTLEDATLPRLIATVRAGFNPVLGEPDGVGQ